MQHAEQERHVNPKSNRSKGQSEIPDHPPAVIINLSTPDHAVPLHSCEEPQRSQNAEPKMSGQAFSDTTDMVRETV